MDKKRLGRGLDALIGGPANGNEALALAPQAEVSVDAIELNPYQPRRTFDTDELSSLTESIRSHGILQPLVVRATKEGRYQLIAGERRLRAAREAGKQAVPVHVVDLNDQAVFEAALIENIQRSDLNPIEKALGFKDYLERFKVTQEELARRVGLARTTVTNIIALLDLPTEIQDAVRVGQLTTGHAKLLKSVPDRERMASLAKDIIARGLSVHDSDAFIKQALQQPAPAANKAGEPRAAAEKTSHVQSIEDELRQKLAVRVEIRVRGKENGQIVLGFESNDDFERLLEVLRK